MANVLGTLFGEIATAIRSKTGDTATMKPAEFPGKISNMELASDPVIQALEITKNGTYTAPDGVDGYSPVTVNVAASGGGTLVAAIGKYTGTDAQVGVNHNLGTVPLVFYTFATTGIGTKTANAMFCAVGFSTEAANLLGITNDYGYTLSWNASAGAEMQNTQDNPIETDLNRPICKATATTISIGGMSSYPKKNTSYTWYALGYKKEE